MDDPRKCCRRGRAVDDGVYLSRGKNQLTAIVDMLKFMEQKDKIRKAQALYEPWMDNTAILEETNDYVLPSPRHATAKHRSQFTFDSEYAKMDSVTPTSSVVSTQSRVDPSRNSTVSIHLPIPTTPEEPTPLPFDERPFYTTKQQSKPRERSIAEASPKQADVTLTKNTAKKSNSKPIPFDGYCRLTSANSANLLIENEYSEFYAWVLNGKETDLSTSEIIRLLFGKNGIVKRKQSTSESMK